MKNSIVALVMLTATSAVANIIVPVLNPQSGCYEFGNSSFQHKGGGSYPYLAADINELDYPDWSSLPSDAKLKCVGSAMVYAAPGEDRTIDWSECGSLLVIGNNVIPDGTKLTFTSGEWFYIYYQTALPANDGSSFTANLSKNNSGVVNFDVCLDGGSWYIADGRSNKITGALTGSSTASSVLLGSAAGSSLTIEGPIDYAGSFEASGGQYGEAFDMKPSALAATEVYAIKIGCNANASQTPQSFHFRPQVSGTTLNLRTLTTAAGSASVDESSTYYRQGGHVLIYSNNTIRTQYLNAGLHIYGDTAMRKTKTTAGTAGLGVGNIIVTTECKAGDGRSMYLGTNINFTVAKVTNAINFDYTAQPDGINPCKLEITGSCNAGVTARATVPAMLPRHVTGLAGTLSLSSSEWSFPFDFNAADPCESGCEGSGTLSAPASGTIAITIANGDKAASGIYSLLTCTSGGEALTAAAWPASINGTVGEQLVTDDAVYTIVRDASGVSLKVKANSGLGLGVW